MARTLADIIGSFISFLRSRQPGVELTEGTPEHDLMIRAPAIEHERFYNRLDQVSREQSIETASDEGMDKIASNFTLLRKGAARTKGSVTMFRTNPTSTNITVPIGTLVSTATNLGATPVQFRTVQEVTMFGSIGGSYLNPVTGKYEISVQVEAVVPGRDANVGSNTINTFTSAITGFDGVYNTFAMSGGTDRESTPSLASRISKALAGSNIGTSDGYFELISDTEEVLDVLVVGNGGSPRDELGAIDIVVKGTKTRSYEETFTPISSSTPSDFVLTKQPIDLTATKSLTDSNLGPLSYGTHWTIISDTTILGGSVRGEDKVHFLTGSVGTLTIQYGYNGLIEDLQAIVDKPSNTVHNTSVLVLQGTQIPIDIAMNIKVLSGYDSVQVAIDVENNLVDALSDYTIGQQVQQADITRIVLNVPGVDDMQLPLTTFQSSDGSIVRNAFGDLDIPNRSYATQFGTITVTVVP